VIIDTVMEELMDQKLTALLDPVIRQIITAERKNYIESGEKPRSIATQVKKIIEDNLNRFDDEN